MNVPAGSAAVGPWYNGPLFDQHPFEGFTQEWFDPLPEYLFLQENRYVSPLPDLYAHPDDLQPAEMTLQQDGHGQRNYVDPFGYPVGLQPFGAPEDCAVSPFASRNTPVDLTTNQSPEPSNPAQSSTVFPPINPIPATSATPPAPVTGGKRSRNGHAKKPYKAHWYQAKKPYSDKTLYNKIGIAQMEEFLAGEGVDIAKTFPGGHSTYVVKDGKHQKINRGPALMKVVKEVHQRVIDRRKAGFDVGPNKAPHLGTEDWNDRRVGRHDKLDAEAETVGRIKVSKITGGANEVSKITGEDRASAAGRAVRALPLNISENLPAMAQMVPTYQPTQVSTTQADTLSPPETSGFISFNLAHRDLAGIKHTIMFQNHFSDSKNQSKQAPTTVDVNSKDLQQAQEKTEELERVVHDTQRNIRISVEAQQFVQRIIHAANQHAEILRCWVENVRLVSRDQVEKEMRAALNEYHHHRANLMQQLIYDITWEPGRVSRGRKVAAIVTEVFPAQLPKISVST